MRDSRIASRYAKSLFLLSKEEGILKEVYSDMNLIADVCKNNRDLVNMLRSPIIKNYKKMTILEKIFNRKVNSFTLGIMRLVTQKNRESIIPSIALEFHNMYNVFMRIQKASIITPIPLDEELRGKIKMIVQKCSNREVIELEERIDEDLIGGFALSIDDKQIDTSLSNQLKSLKVSFMRK